MDSENNADEHSTCKRIYGRTEYPLSFDSWQMNREKCPERFEQCTNKYVRAGQIWMLGASLILSMNHIFSRTKGIGNETTVQ